MHQEEITVVNMYLPNSGDLNILRETQQYSNSRAIKYLIFNWIDYPDRN